MTDPIRTCEDHGAFSGDRCPVCGEAGTHRVGASKRRRLSKYLSGALRHFPADAGLELDERGWTDYATLVESVTERYEWAKPVHVAAVIATDPKGRFERTGERDERDGLVRAAYGHSVDVAPEPEDAPVPNELYHGTAPESLESIRTEGIRPMSRQRVHLSGTLEEARRIGSRHASDPAVLVVDAAAMLAEGHRIAKRGPETYTTDRVPPAYFSVYEAGNEGAVLDQPAERDR